MSKILKLRKKKFKEDEILAEKAVVRETQLQNTNSILKSTINRSQTSEGDVNEAPSQNILCRESTAFMSSDFYEKEREDALVDKSTDEEPAELTLHDKSNSFEAYELEDFMTPKISSKKKKGESLSLFFDTVPNNAIDHILSETDDLAPDNIFHGFREQTFNRSIAGCSAIDIDCENITADEMDAAKKEIELEIDIHDKTILRELFDDVNKQFENKARLHILGSKSRKIGKMRKKKKKLNKKRILRSHKMNEVKELKKALKRKIEILKIQRVKRTLNKRDNENDQLPERHHLKYLKHVLHLFKKTEKGKHNYNLTSMDKSRKWKFAWVNFTEYTKTEDSLSYFHQRILNLPKEYIDKEIFNKLSAIKNNLYRNTNCFLGSPPPSPHHAMFFREPSSNLIYLVVYQFREDKQTKFKENFSINFNTVCPLFDQQSNYFLGKASLKQKVKINQNPIKTGIEANVLKLSTQKSCSLTQPNTPDINTSNLFNYGTLYSKQVFSETCSPPPLSSKTISKELLNHNQDKMEEETLDSNGINLANRQLHFNSNAECQNYSFPTTGQWESETSSSQEKPNPFKNFLTNDSNQFSKGSISSRRSTEFKIDPWFDLKMSSENKVQGRKPIMIDGFPLDYDDFT